ncbi:MAG: site-2 protease family protein [Candidatus Wolfebacteria bacterium]|nr:site-2 protease family protein [Candidatus Wolfebacteria bacterium]
MSNPIIFVFQLITLIASVIIHEVSHGFVAYRLGDSTAKDMGRLTLNPLKHLDFFGSFLFPLVLFLFGSPILFGWAKPVPYNPYNLKDPQKGGGLIAAAGPLSNLSVAVIFGFILKFFSMSGMVDSPLFLFLQIIILINISLAIFNLVPIPPLDGSKILFAFLPPRFSKAQIFLEQYGFMFLLLFIFFGIRLIQPIISKLFMFLGGGF